MQGFVTLATADNTFGIVDADGVKAQAQQLADEHGQAVTVKPAKGKATKPAKAAKAKATNGKRAKAAKGEPGRGKSFPRWEIFSAGRQRRTGPTLMTLSFHVSRGRTARIS